MKNAESSITLTSDLTQPERNCSQCSLAGTCSVRGVTITPEMAIVCRKRPDAIDRLLAPRKEPTTVVPRRNPRPARSCRECSTVGTVLRAAVEAEIGRKITCGTCAAYLKSLNTTASHNVEAITQKLYAEIEWPKHWRDQRGDKEGQKARIAEIVTAAIASAPAVACRPQRRATPQRGRKHSRGRRPYTGWRSEADGPRIQHGPFVSAIRHLTYHVYAAKKHDSWQWNLEQLAKRWSLFNGKRLIGISEGPEAQPASAVIAFAESLGMMFDHHVVRPNNEKLREVVTFVPMLSILKPESAGANEVVFSAHAKGQKYDDARHTRGWTDLMYQSCLDDWPAVYNALRTSLMAGSMREYGLLGKWHDWAYSGTFFWWRLAEIGKRKWRDVDQWFAGTESWPGKMCDPRETACLFLNDSRRMYDAHYWTETVWPEWAKYLEARNGR